MSNIANIADNLGVSFLKTQGVSVLTVLIVGIGTLHIVRSIYRRHFHPLSQFSGPPEAALSTNWLYKTNQGGFPEHEFERLHERYQTKALRIAPNELHLSDVHQYKVIYSQSKPFLKYPPFYSAFNIDHSLFAETDPALHKERRKILNPLFSRTAVFKMEGVIHTKAGIMMKKIDRLNEKLINAYDAFRCLTTEVIMEFAFARSANMLEEEESTFDSWFLRAFDSVASDTWTAHEWPLLRKIGSRLPKSLVKIMNKKVVDFLKVINFAESCMNHYEKHGNTTSHPVVFDHLPSVAYPQKITEAMDILVAGSDTTAATLTAALLHILADQKVHNKLVEAVQSVQLNEQGILPLLELEKIDYLTACVKESLRIGMPVPGRLPRIVPHNLPQPFTVDGKVIPAGTVISISAYTMHYSEELWGPDARTFNPERWLQPESKNLDQYLCTFSKGARMCIGQNIAFAEITIVMAYIFRNYKLSLPPDFQRPKQRDFFTMEYEKPGLPVKFEAVN
ncbi:cytochrome P450 oxidoreductase [Aspergillus nomiae NRRL 13137]|uniref:Cytochrome P450 oxidoreductase n=1 Tax=Aspergillus nomiae NRRL (strain ATCC 15546 / NRRL 13137 / CBS 260.88 / M93) TaxID=1509407 RepID=A0A0L1IXY1_ASPN3|nr:cytochrome P450 oxidoreductase [Aspergillus nomiae NRRL 13137]KNG84013.1 cytochrome P450 oxidoreductase [Aspergillus nomiae NRRL 13137]